MALSPKRLAPAVGLLLTLVVAAVGVFAFYQAMRPCVLSLQPGMAARYVLTHEYRVYPSPEADSGIEPILRSDRQEVVLIGLDEGGECALIARSGAGRRDEWVALKHTPQGKFQRRTAGELLDNGPVMGFFDFNLMPLPQGLEQGWDADVIYGYPPPVKRQHSVRIRRTHNGARPRFAARLPTIEWIDRVPGSTDPEFRERYSQIKDLEVRYRFDTRRGVVDEASMRFLAGVETRDGLVRHEVVVTLELVELAPIGDDPSQLRQFSAAISAIDRALAGQRSDHLKAAMANLNTVTVRSAALQEVAARLRQDVDPHPGPGAWAIQVASVGSNQRTQAEGLRLGLVADGYPAFVRATSGGLAVIAGPFAERQDAVLVDLTRRYPSNKPFWLRVSP